MAQLFSFLALLCLYINQYLFIAIFHPVSQITAAIYAFGSFLGVALCSLIGPFFLPLPGKKIRLVTSILFIFILVIPNFIIRSLGMELWINFGFIRFITGLLSGMLIPICIGLLFLSCYKPDRLQTAKTENRYQWLCPLLYAIAICGGIIARHTVVNLIHIQLSTEDQLKTHIIVFNILNWLLAGIGLFTAFSVICLKNDTVTTVNNSADSSMTNQISAGQHSDKKFIFSLIGIALVFFALNGIMEWQLSPDAANVTWRFQHSYLIMVIFVCLFAFLAGRSITKFLRMFLFPALILFIVIPCLVLFKDYPNFIFIKNIFISVFHNLLRVIFPLALLEAYKPVHSRYGAYWFYTLAGIIPFLAIVTFITSIFGTSFPTGTEFTIWIAGIASVLFALLSFRILFPKGKTLMFTPQPKIVQTGIFKNEASQTDIIQTEISETFDDMFLQYGLTEREKEVANLMIHKGFNNKEIAERIFLAPVTVREYVSNIYRKFNVKRRSEFMAKFIKMGKMESKV